MPLDIILDHDVAMSLRNPSAPPYSVVPVLTYDDVGAAVDWLIRVFGFTERVRIGDHRAQLAFGDGAVIVADAARPSISRSASGSTRGLDPGGHHWTFTESVAEVRPETWGGITVSDW